MVAVLVNVLWLIDWFRVAAGIAILDGEREKEATVENLFRECARIKNDC